MARRRLTPLAKFLIFLAVVAGLFFAGKWIFDQGYLDSFIDKTEANNNNNNNNGENTEKVTTKFSNNDADLRVQIFTWGGYAPGIYMNGGAAPNTDSRFYKDYGIKVAFELIDDFGASRNAWRAGLVDVLGSTADAIPTEMEGLQEYDPKIILQCDWSRGGDAIVAARGINSINDLVGKKVAFTPLTPSQTFLIKTLEAAGLSLDDIDAVETGDNLKAAAAFKTGNVDAAVVWSPDDEIAVQEVPGSKILQSTKTASHIIADILVARGDVVNQKPDVIEKFYQGWMQGAAEINSSDAARSEAIKYFTGVIGLDDEFSELALNNVRLTTHGDNVNFFGMDRSYKGMKGEDLYSGMGVTFEKLGFADASRPSWRTVAYTAPVRNFSPTGNGHEAEGQKTYNPSTEKDATIPSFAQKKVEINFPTGVHKLDANAMTIIDLQFAEIAKAFGNARVRIEGNTDNVGSRASNIALSKKRAESVAKYLQDTYGMDSNRFIIVGNGPDKPVKGCEKNATDQCRSKNRRTEFQLIAE